jgi:hypothetical protein
MIKRKQDREKSEGSKEENAYLYKFVFKKNKK